jgi:hypothetical protein
MKSILQRVGAVPFVKPVATFVLAASYVAEVALVLAWGLRCLEIPSIFERWLPGSAWYLLLVIACVVVAQGVWSQAVDAMHHETVVWPGSSSNGATKPLGPPAVGSDETARIARPSAKWGTESRQQ